MILSLLFENPAIAVVLILAIALTISIHEAAHAWVAEKLGDPTAAALGRTTLNPLAHLDPIGTLMIVVAGFGWGKPVPVNDSRLKHKYDMVWVALAGPASNLLLALALSIIFRLTGSSVIQEVLAIFILINLGLMVFNLIPIPPLDGSKLLQLVIPRQTFQLLEQYGFVIIIVLFFMLRFGSFGLSELLGTAVTNLFHLFTGSGIALY